MSNIDAKPAMPSPDQMIEMGVQATQVTFGQVANVNSKILPMTYGHSLDRAPGDIRMVSTPFSTGIETADARIAQGKRAEKSIGEPTAHKVLAADFIRGGDDTARPRTAYSAPDLLREDGGMSVSISRGDKTRHLRGDNAKIAAGAIAMRASESAAKAIDAYNAKVE